MDESVLRVLDANLNRAREGLRVLEDYVRFCLDEAGLSEQLKRARHALVAVAGQFGPSALLSARNTPADVGTGITVASESTRSNVEGVARAASARVEEALRCIEEYGKIVAPDAAAQIERLRYDVYSIEQAIFVSSPRRQRLYTARLHVLLTESLCRNNWFDTARTVLASGADAIQLREKTLTDAELLRRAAALRALTREHEALLIVNDRADIARLAGADGVHLGQDDLAIADARRIAGPTSLIGRSTHSHDEIVDAIAQGADYIGVGPMFASETKPEVTVRGPALLSFARHRLATIESRRIPIVAIGGIAPHNVAELNDSNGPTPAVAVCGAIIGDADPAGATRRLLTMIADRTRSTCTHSGSD